ncbi:hypothetical protein HYW11_01935 [Candidatus Peregrinibacteria bacterium]|nr:hypothetical protein [Candidatus Peregrinibacteria bacterium]
MTERFDRVLCDAPCTAQGTVRKDSDALSYCGKENVEKMARLQAQLLEAAIHAAKVGGRIVYSTCTLTPEENEGVVFSVREKYHDQLKIMDPCSLPVTGYSLFDRTVNDSVKVQECCASGLKPTIPRASSVPFFRKLLLPGQWNTWNWRHSRRSVSRCLGRNMSQENSKISTEHRFSTQVMSFSVVESSSF